MRRIDFNENWKWKHLGADENWRKTELPHDAMIGEPRSPDNPGGTNTGWFEGRDYEYTKIFFLPEEYADKVILFEFEGVYRNAEVYINGKKAAYRPYGYTNFYVPANDFLRYGAENELRVIARNSDQPNSRWYSGAGIYRPVTMYIADKAHIRPNGIKIRTLAIEPAVVEVKVSVSEAGRVNVKLCRDGKTAAEDTAECNGEAVFLFTLENAALWSPESPALYECEVSFGRDAEKETFGIRTLSCTAGEGLCVNGKRVILRGACIHHDNGILGARCYAEAEERKIRLLKNAGYNAVRSAHNPCSKAMLRACDELGVMVMDEYVDMWYIHKTMYDYANCVSDWYKQDIADMVEKDYNHPSVVLYSLGNEVAETGQREGIEFFKTMRDVCKKLDAERPVTVGVNIFFNWLHAIGFGVYSDKKAGKNPQKKVGSAFFNELAGFFGGGFMKFMATLPFCDVKTRDCYAAMDVAGYNYGILRYKKDVKKYPDRVILGSETFCADAYKFREFAENHNALIGDFVWTGMDYLGEAGIGSWEYGEYAPDFSHGAGWISAGSGRLNLIGSELGEALYTKVAFGLEDKPLIAVVPVSHTGEKHSPSAWKFSNAIPSWSWNGLNGEKAEAEVYSRAPFVELYINGKKAGRKKFKKNCRFKFKVTYRDGEITAVNLDKNGKEINRNSLKTAGNRTVLTVLPEKTEVNGGEICFVKLRFTDENGVLKPLERGRIELAVEGGELLAAGHACPFNRDGYLSGGTDTYYGEALAAVKATSDEVKVTAISGNLQSTARIAVKSIETTAPKNFL